MNEAKQLTLSITGSKGIVKKLYANKAVVDMGLVGTWNVPYYFLSETA